MKNTALTITLFLGVAIAWVLFPFYGKYFTGSYDSLSALFSGLAFVGIISTIMQQRQQLEMQKEELILQREELKMTREELKRSASAQEKSEKALREQVENMETTAKLNTLNILFNIYNEKASSQSVNWTERERAKTNATQIARKLEALSERILK